MTPPPHWADHSKLYHPFWIKLSPNIQPRFPLVQLKAVPSLCHLVPNGNSISMCQQCLLKPRKVYQQHSTTRSTVEKMLRKHPGEAGSPQDLIVSQNSLWLFPTGLPAKGRFLIALRKEKNKDGNEKCKCLQILAGIHCKCLCSKSPQPCFSLKEEQICFWHI